MFSGYDQQDSQEFLTFLMDGLHEGLNKVCLFFFFLTQFNVPFQDYFSSYETGQSVGGAKTGDPRDKTPDTPTSRTWLVSHVARAGLEPTPVTAVR